ncbi:lysophospholipid acyltransferase family protein [Planosporangium mesophilum]|uniref:1-acyl-sn-glycerol-3-phosphate acyltransferase n=1 Tax=Planosporangium mesophilum TaxID=689768 RepID=A0A8J3T9G8_9ACTN|nr:lysophospholipid acyltransferase family protein [Planosporangium mesophilum]NJC81321.1 1-acyl-sn-glycerol-3-phosphate acyltransferase [Planosporangium mesophilum]GII21026.1 1-acyl-sn-glycerol-3-phosphate acyltransferase [Planosporangium mesophilum]
MVTESLWLPRSTCDIYCLPSPDSVPRVGRLRVVARAAAAAAVIAAAAVTLPVIPLLPPAGRARLMSLYARGVLGALGVGHDVRGRLPRRGALIVANHVSWLDVLVLLGSAPSRLLAKREVRSWPVIGSLAAVAGTVFIDRLRPRALPRTVASVSAALRAGGVVAVFPEGTTSCGRTSGRFRPAMFQAAIDAGVPVAPVTLRFRLAGGGDTSIAAFLGEDTLLASLRRVLTIGGLHVTVQVHPALYPVPGVSRRTLARVARSVVHGPPRSWTADGAAAPLELSRAA